MDTEYELVETQDDIETDELSVGDIGFIVAGCIVACMVVAFIFRQIKATFKNVHVKIGDKIELGVETKEDKQL